MTALEIQNALADANLSPNFRVGDMHVTLAQANENNNAYTEISIESIDDEGNHVSKTFIPIPIIVNLSYRQDNPIEIKDIAGNVLGNIYFAKQGQKIEIGDLSAPIFAAYLVDVEDTNTFELQEYKLTKDYTVIDAARFADYIPFMDTSALWGGFHHIIPNPPPTAYQIPVAEIKVVDNLTWRTPTLHRETAIRGIQQPYAFERFLKNYHLLELLFDWQIVEDIKNLGADLVGAGEILNEYDRKDIPRLHYLLEKKITTENALLPFLERICNFLPIAKNLFYKYGKESNPIKEEVKFDEITTQALAQGCVHHFDENNLKAKKVNSDYRKFLIHISAYWIYRVRCSIAHSKIGEYIMSYNDEAFVVEFAEPLLKEVLLQCFRQ